MKFKVAVKAVNAIVVILKINIIDWNNPISNVFFGLEGKADFIASLNNRKRVAVSHSIVAGAILILRYPCFKLSLLEYYRISN